MKKSTIKLSDITKKDPFNVPEGYFESLPESIVSKLPERIPEKTVQISLWNKMKPYIYMAAMFAGIALTIKVFVGISHQNVNTYASKSLDLRSSTDIDDFYYYYENELAKIVYNDALDDLEEENY